MTLDSVGERQYIRLEYLPIYRHTSYILYIKNNAQEKQLFNLLRIATDLKGAKRIA